jgi:hypothetical protein
MSDLPANGITAAAVSAIVATGLYIVKEYWIEPRRWKRNIRIAQLEKRLEAYGTLLVILQSCARKGLRQTTGFADMTGSEDQVDLAIETKKGHLHLLENPRDADALQSLFEKSSYLMSKELRNEWLTFVRKDEYFAHFDSHHAEKGGLLRADLWQMQRIAQADYDGMQTEYDKLMGQNKGRSPPDP